MKTSYRSKMIMNPAKDEMLHGRLGYITQEIERYNDFLTREQKKEKFSKMSISPFSFYRGTAHLFWLDFAWDWRVTRFGNYRTRAWLNGDCHAMNFGAYFSHDVGIIYGLNDFDESVVADYQYDLWRLAISLVLITKEPAASNNGSKKFRDLSGIKINDVLDSLSKAYLETMEKFSKNEKAKKTYYNVKNTSKPLRKFLEKVEKKKGRVNMLKDWTKMVNDQLKFDSKLDEVEELDDELYQLIESKMPEYIKTLESDIDFPTSYFNVLDIIRRRDAGTGSLGLDRYYILVEGNSPSPDDNIILDVKEEIKPSAYPFATNSQKARYADLFPNEGIRYTIAYRALDYHPDDHLGWVKIKDKFFGIRERNAFKKSFKPEKDFKSEKDFISMAGQWGTILATEHSRARKWNPYNLGEEILKVTDGKLSEFQKVVRKVASGYADVVKSDYDLFVQFVTEKYAVKI